MISTDEEQGPVSRLPYVTRFPSNKLLASTKDPDEDARLAAKVTGEELRAVGINQDNAPDADVNINPNNPVIGVRSFGADPKKVAHLVGVAIDAYRATGVAAVAKHFPGHGDTDDRQPHRPADHQPLQGPVGEHRRAAVQGRRRAPRRRDHDRAHRGARPGQVP